MNRIIYYLYQLFYKFRSGEKRVSFLGETTRTEHNTNLKLIREHGLDGFIDVYIRSARRLMVLGEEQELERLLIIMHSNLKRIGVDFRISSSGTEFDHETMYISDAKSSYLTNNPELANKVSISVVPLITWKSSVTDQSDQNTILKKEEVILWQYTNKIIQEDNHQENSVIGVSSSSVQPNILPASVSSIIVSQNKQAKAYEPIGFLVLIKDQEIISILTIERGVKNVYGSSPQERDNVSCHQVSILDDQLTTEHFSIQQDNENKSIEAILLHGSWGINSKYSSNKRTILSDGDIINIGDLSFKYIENEN